MFDIFLWLRTYFYTQDDEIGLTDSYFKDFCVIDFHIKFDRIKEKMTIFDNILGKNDEKVKKIDQKHMLFYEYFGNIVK